MSRAPIRIWFDLARAGNFPSVASNVLAALILSSGVPVAPPWRLLLLSLVAGCLLYAGGATCNDVADAAFDQKHRPERAIPRGLTSRGTAAAVGALEMLAGAALLLYAGASLAWLLALIGTILLYDWLHKRWAGSVGLMAGCRVLLAGAIATLPGHTFTTPFLAWVVALFLYIVTLSVIARLEYRPGVSAGKLGKAVRQLLAFIPLVDAIALLAFGAWIPAIACVAAIPLGRFAQRLAASS
jgi:4-hydroxybenzoate polyprenyltransferase